MSSADGGTVSRDRLVRQVFAERPINVREVDPPAAAPMSLALRKYPFPYKAALALSNDPRTMSGPVFDEVHAALDERSLEIGATLSFGPGEPFEVGSARAGLLHEAGLADSVTGLPAGGAAEALQRLQQSGLTPTCYIGDPPVAEAAPLAEAGVRYFTDSAFVIGEKFGDLTEFRSTVRLMEGFGRFSYDELGDGSDGGTDIDALFESRSPADKRALAVALFNKPVVEIAAPDGRLLNIFKRYRGPQRPAATTLPLQLRSMFLDILESTTSAVIVEQRLGEFALLGQTPANEQRRSPEDSVLTEHELVALDELAVRASENLLVTLPGRLLDWLRLRSTLTFEVDETDDVWLIRLTGCDAGPVSRAMLDGLAFTLPTGAPKVVVLVQGEAEPLAMQRQADPALAGQDCVFLSWQRRPWPKL